MFEREKSNFRVKKPGSLHWNKVISVTVTRRGHTAIPCCLMLCTGETKAPSRVGFRPRAGSLAMLAARIPTLCENTAVGNQQDLSSIYCLSLSFLICKMGPLVHATVGAVRISCDEVY